MRFARNPWLYVLVVVIVGVTYLFLSREGGEDQARLDVYNWPYYIEEEVLAGFEDRFDVKINYQEFPSNEVLLTAVENKSGGWDVVFPSDYMVSIMARKGLLIPIQKDLLSNWNNLDRQFVDPAYDPGNRYSVPYIWGATGIGYRKDRISPAPEDYGVLWNPQYKGRIGMLDDMRFSMAAPLLWKGYSPNTTDPAELEDAKDLLLQQKPLVRAYNSENYVDLLTGGETWVFYGYSGDIIQAIPENPEIGFVIPESGAALYVDNMVIPQTADEISLAHDFMNYLLEGRVAARIINSRWFAMPNNAAREYVRPEILNHPGVYPAPEVLKKSASIEDLGDAAEAYERIWQAVKSRQE